MCILAPSTPTIHAVVNSSESVHLLWTVQDDGGNIALSYSLRQWTDHDGVGILLLTNTVDSWYLVDNLMPNTSYWFSVVAHSNTGNSSEGWSSHVTTKPCECNYV